jgi:tetratricopeptide (TPR) repeat protein
VALVSLFIFYAGAFNYAPIQNMMGVRAFRDGSYKESVELYTQAISINPRNSLYFTNRAKAHRALRDNKSALNDCKRALNLDPKNENALKLLAKLRAGQ